MDIMIFWIWSYYILLIFKYLIINMSTRVTRRIFESND
jgi:hypothetical protein